MIESDTIKLLRECDAGIKMGVSAIDDVIDNIKNENLENQLSVCKTEHEKLKEEVNTLLDEYHDKGKEPTFMAKSMSKMKTKMKMLTNCSDETIADLVTDGCNMGVKSLNRYLKQYEAADEKSKDIAKRLINLEESLTINIRKYL